MRDSDCPPLVDEDTLPGLEEHDRELDEFEAKHGSLEEDETYAMMLSHGDGPWV